MEGACKLEHSSGWFLCSNKHFYNVKKWQITVLWKRAQSAQLLLFIFQFCESAFAFPANPWKTKTFHFGFSRIFHFGFRRMFHFGFSRMFHFGFNRMFHSSKNKQTKNPSNLEGVSFFPGQKKKMGKVKINFNPNWNLLFFYPVSRRGRGEKPNTQQNTQT